MPLSSEELEELFQELRRRMNESGLGDIDAAILRLESELNDPETLALRSSWDPSRRLRFYVDQLEATLGGSVEAYHSTLSLVREHVETTRSPQFRLIVPPQLERSIGGDSVDLERLSQPVELLRELRQVLNEAMEG